MEIVKYKIHKQDASITLREFLENFHVGKKTIYKWFLNKEITINGNIAKELDIVNEDDILGIQIEEIIDVTPSKNICEVVYEDDYLLIVNKPVGIIIHSDGNDNNDTLVNRVAKYYQEKGISRNVRYLHRIDNETSGIVVFAKDLLTYSLLSYQIEMHILKREYLALVEGNFKNKEGTINAPIGRDRHVSNKYRVGKSQNSKDAVTHYYVLKNYQGFAYIRLLLETGRTHQIRVHMASIDHPLLGDKLYGGKIDRIKRVALHSFRVSMKHPYTKERFIVEVNEPSDMENLLF